MLEKPEAQGLGKPRGVGQEGDNREEMEGVQGVEMDIKEAERLLGDKEPWVPSMDRAGSGAGGAALPGGSLLGQNNVWPGASGPDTGKR